MLYGVPDGLDLNDPQASLKPDGTDSIMDKDSRVSMMLQETTRIFEAYAGAVAAQPNLGHIALFRWIVDLVNVQ